MEAISAAVLEWLELLGLECVPCVWLLWGGVVSDRFVDLSGDTIITTFIGHFIFADGFDLAVGWEFLHY